MPTTTNFGWTTPADTDLVKDGAAAIRTLGSGIDTSLIDLKGGTTGQVLTKATNTDLDYSWVTPNVGDITEVQAGAGISIASGTGPIPVITNSSTDLITTAGDLLYGTAADTVARLGIGTAGQVLTVNSGATAPEWAAPATGGMTLISTTTLSGTSTTISSIPGTYKNLQIVFVEMEQGGTAYMQFQLNSDTGSNYTYHTNGAPSKTAYIGWDYGAAPQSLEKYSGNMYIYDYANTNSTRKKIWTQFNIKNGATNWADFSINATYHSSSAISSITVKTFASGTIGGTVLIYGVN